VEQVCQNLSIPDSGQTILVSGDHKLATSLEKAKSSIIPHGTSVHTAVMDEL
jgi:hypothetical protein